MNDTKFTPGPWAVEMMPSGRITVTAGQLFVAGDDNDVGLGVDDAHLIAAAPDSHEANKVSLLVLCALEKANDWHPNMAKDIAFAIEANRTALAKATGAALSSTSHGQGSASEQKGGV